MTAALWQDVRYGLRMLAKNRGFTAIALVTLAIGIGANTIMFSISDLLLLRPRNVKDPEELAFCAIQGADSSWFRYAEYLALHDSGLAFRDLMAEDSGVGRSATLVCGGTARKVETTYVSANYFFSGSLKESVGEDVAFWFHGLAWLCGCSCPAAPAPGGQGHASRFAWCHAPAEPGARCWIL